MNERFGIGAALEWLRKGKRVARAGWNGKNMWLAYQAGYPAGIPINANTARATGLPEGTVCRFLPYLMMRTADGAFVPWLASQTDILADDWALVDEAPTDEADTGEASEAEWLTWFAQNADFGPADGDVRQHMREQFEKKTGRLVPRCWRDDE